MRKEKGRITVMILRLPVTGLFGILVLGVLLLKLVALATGGYSSMEQRILTLLLMALASAAVTSFVLI